MPYFQYRDSRCKDKTVSWQSYLSTGNTHARRKPSLYWDGTQVTSMMVSSAVYKRPVFTHILRYLFSYAGNKITRIDIDSHWYHISLDRCLFQVGPRVCTIWVQYVLWNVHVVLLWIIFLWLYSVYHCSWGIYVIIYLIYFWIVSLTHGQSYDCPSASEVTANALMPIVYIIRWIYYVLW